MKKKILFPFSANTKGGSIISSLILIEELKKRNFKPVILVHGNGPSIEYLRERKLDYVRTNIPYYRENDNFFSFFCKLIINFIPMIKILIRIKAPIIHLNDSKMVNTWTIVSRILFLKVVIHQRTRLFRSRFLEYNLSKADNVIVISDYIRNSLKVIKLKNVNLIYNLFIAPKNTKKSLRKNICNKNKIDENSFIVGYFSRFSKQKRPELFIEASTKVSKNIKIKFIMMGMFEDEIQKNRILDFIKKKDMTKHVFIEQFNHNVYEAIRSFDVLVCPSIDEGFGRTIVEAGFVKTPVIASNSGAFNELVVNNKTGLLFDPDNVNDLSKKIMTLYSDSNLRKNISNNFFETLKEKFIINNSLEDLITIYDNL